MPGERPFGDVDDDADLLRPSWQDTADETDADRRGAWRPRPMIGRGVAQGGVAGGMIRAASGSRAARAATARINAAAAMSSVVMAQISVVMRIRTLPPIG